MNRLEDEATKQGNMLQDQGDLEGAIAAYTEAIRLHPQNAQPHSNRGQAYLRKGEFDKAIADCNQAIQLDPTMAEAYCARASCHGRNGDLDKAMADCTEAIRLDPHDARVYCVRGIVYALKGDCDRAIADFTESIRLDPKLPQGFYNRGNAYLGKGKFDKAIADFTESIRLDARRAEAYWGRAYAYAKKGESDKAIADFAESLRLDPRRADTYWRRAHVYAEQGEFDKAIADYTEAIQLNPQSAEAYLGRSHVYNEKREFDKAFSDYAEAIRLNPEYNDKSLPVLSEADAGGSSPSPASGDQEPARGYGARLYMPKSAGFWGDYGRILIAGFGGRQNGLVALERTGPFVPPISFPSDAIIVTDAFRGVLAKEFPCVRFRPVIKHRIVSLRWEQWERTVDLPPRLPPGGEPENYILRRGRSEKAAQEMGPLWELVVQPVLQYRSVGDWRDGYVYYVLRHSWNGDHFTSLAHPAGFIIPVVTDVAKQFLELHAGEWLDFEEVVVVDQLP